MANSLRLEFKPDLDQVTRVRRFVADFFGGMLHDDDLAARLAMATHELLENAMKYSADGVARLSIDVEDAPISPRVLIELRNRAEPQHLDNLRQAFDEMNGVEPFEYYQRLMRRIAQRTEGSGLGLARIRAEGEMSLLFALENDEVCLRAAAQGAGEQAS